MLTPEQRAGDHRSALRRRLVTPEQVELHAPESRPPAATADVRRISAPAAARDDEQARISDVWSARRSPARKLGLLDDATIQELNSELRSSEMTTETAALKAASSRRALAPPRCVQLPCRNLCVAGRATSYSMSWARAGWAWSTRPAIGDWGAWSRSSSSVLTDPKMAQRFLNEAQ